MTDINTRLQKHYDAAVAHFGKNAVFGVFLYGSWNYKTNLLTSDVDTKCILIPDLFTLVIKPFKVTHLHIDDEVCECMSIMHMVENWKKQNINFVEIMFTPYFKLNPSYADFWAPKDNDTFEPFALSIEKREKIARYDIKKAVLSMANQAIHTIKQDPTDLKKIMNGARIAYSLSLLTRDNFLSYIEVIRVPSRIAKIRIGEVKVPAYGVQTLLKYFEEMIASADQWAPNKEKQKEVDDFLNDFILNLINYRISIN